MPYLTAMRIVALIAFVALQLSVLTCGFDDHVHTTNTDLGHIAQHLHDNGAAHQNTDNHACHVHASHTFVEVVSKNITTITLMAAKLQYISTTNNIRKIPFPIENPPKA